MDDDRSRVSSPFRRFVAAEFRKIFAFRMAQYSYAFIFATTYLYMTYVYYVEELPKHLSVTSAYAILPLLFFATWKSLLLHMFVVAFSVHCVTVESQYGMIRVVAAQPLTRSEYVFGKYLAISAHVALIAGVYLASLAFWSVAYGDSLGVTAEHFGALARFSLRIVLLMIGVAWISVSIALLCRTQMSALVIAGISFMTLGLLTTYRAQTLGQYHFVRHFMAPLGEVPMPYRFEFPWYPLATFLWVTLATCAAFLLPALFHFHRRDITE